LKNIYNYNIDIPLTVNPWTVDRFLPLPVQLNTGNHHSVLTNLTYNVQSSSYKVKISNHYPFQYELTHIFFSKFKVITHSQGTFILSIVLPSNVKSDLFLLRAFDPFVANNWNLSDKNVTYQKWGSIFKISLVPRCGLFTKK